MHMESHLIKLLEAKKLKNLSYIPDTTSTRHKFLYQRLTSKKVPTKTFKIPNFLCYCTYSPWVALEERFFTRKIKSFTLPLIDSWEEKKGFIGWIFREVESLSKVKIRLGWVYAWSKGVLQRGRYIALPFHASTCISCAIFPPADGQFCP